MKFNEIPILNKIGGLVSSAIMASWMKTLDYKAALYDPATDPASPDCRQQKIYIFWHEYIFFPLYIRSNCNIAMLVSQHRDAEMLSYAANHMGFELVRGSTTRGGAAALRQLLQKSKNKHLSMTPDGPRGPRRHLSLGAVFLASKLELPLVTMGFGYDRLWRVNSWDKFAFPRPFSRARAIIGPEIHVPQNLKRDGLEHFRLKTEQLLTRLTVEAEAWAEAGTPKVGQQKLRQTRAPKRSTK